LAEAPWRGDYGSYMKTYTQKASVIWLGTQQRGKGAVSTPSAALRNAPYGSGSDLKRKGTSPAELIAAAHAGSFSMTLAKELGVDGYSPSQIDTTATVTLEDIAAGWTMTQIHLDVGATVPLATQCDFIDAALRAKANCPISRLLSANISMRAHLIDQAGDPRLKHRRSSAAPPLGDGRKNRARRMGASN
jgi:lipoyl-dependent peroxiredoxin